MALLELGKTNEAIQAFQSAVAFNPRFYRAYFRLSKALNDMGRYKEGLDAAKNCLKINKRFAPAYIEEGRAYTGLNQLSNAIKAYQSASRDVKWRQFSQYHIDELKRKLKKKD